MSVNGPAFLRSIKVSDFPHADKNGGKILQFDSHEKIRSAMKKLVELNVHSAPVWDEAEQQYIGMLDMIDIVEFITEVFDESEVKGEGFESVAEQVERFSTNEVKNVADLSRRNPFVPVPDDADLYPVVEILSRFDVHRVNVFDKDGKLSNIITQSAVVDLLAKNLDKIGDVANKSIAELGIGGSPVITVNIRERTINAFRTIREHHLYALPVIGADGAIVANISAKDMRLIARSPANFYMLYEPISHFLAEMHQDEIDVKTPAIVCKPTDTLATVIRKLVQNRIHRVYVLNHDNSPAKVVSLTDVLQTLTQPLPEEWAKHI